MIYDKANDFVSPLRIGRHIASEHNAPKDARQATPNMKRLWFRRANLFFYDIYNMAAPGRQLRFVCVVLLSFLQKPACF